MADELEIVPSIEIDEPLLQADSCRQQRDEYLAVADALEVVPSTAVAEPLLRADSCRQQPVEHLTVAVDEMVTVLHVLVLVPAVAVGSEQTALHSGMLSSYRAKPQGLAETAWAALAADRDFDSVHRFDRGPVHAGVGTSAQTAARKYLAAVAAAVLGR